MKSTFAYFILFQIVFLSSFAFAVDSKTCQLFRVVDPSNEYTNSEIVKGILESKGYEVSDISSLEETKSLPEDTFWGYFDFTPSVQASCLSKVNSCNITVNFYQVNPDPTTEKGRETLLFHSKSQNPESSFRAKNLCFGVEAGSLALVPECKKVVAN
jgi:hypothetical protein